MTDDQKVVQVLSKVIVNTVKNMMGDYDQTVAQKLKNIQISGDNILPMSIDSTKIQKGSIQMADIENLEAKIAEIVQVDITHAEIDTAQIRDLTAYVANVVYANIDWARINWASIASLEVGQATVGQLFADQATIKNLEADVIWGGKTIHTQGLADKFYINELAVNDASIVDLTVNKIKVLGQDGVTYYNLIADNVGVVTEAVKLNGTFIKTESADGSIIVDGTLNGDDKIVGGSITARSLAAHTITANEILAGTITGNEIAANTIEANNIKAGAITTNHLASDVGANLDLSSNTSIVLRTVKGLENSNYLLGTRTGSSVVIGGNGTVTTTRYLGSDSGNAVLAGNITDDFTLSFEYVVGGNESDAVTVTPYIIKPPAGAMRYTITSGVQELNCGSSGTYSCTFKLTNTQSLLGEYAFYFGIAGTEGIDFTLFKLKLEKGTSRTTYNYALEEGSETLDSQLSVMNDKIRAEVTDEITTVTQDTADSLKTELTGEIEATADTITQRVSVVESNQDELSGNYAEIVTKVDGVTTTVQDMSDQQAKWFHMGTDGLEIGERTLDPDTGQWEAGDFTTLLNNTKLAFKQNGEEVAYISNLALLITQAAIKDTFSLGGLNAVLDGYAVNWVFDSDAPLVRRNYFSGTATPNSITMISSNNFRYGTEIDIVPAGQALINGNTTDTFTVSFDYKLTGVVSAAPNFEFGMLFLSSEVGSSYVWPVRVNGGNNFSTIQVDGVSNTYNGQFVSTFKLTANQAEATITQMRGYIRTASVNGSRPSGFTPTLTISNLKLEKNDTATPWVKALEDPYTNTNS